MTYLPDPATLFTFVAASLLLFFTPGPDMSLFLARTLAHGPKAGLATVAGTNAGCLVHTLLASFGVSALIAASSTAFSVLKVAGATYLLWLAWKALRQGSSFTLVSAGEQTSPLACFLMGLMVNLLNPKVVLFFITFLPQFVDAHDPHVTGKLLFLGVLFVAISIPPTLAMIWGADQLVGWLKARPQVLRGLDYGFAAVFALFALRIAATQGR